MKYRQIISSFRTLAAYDSTVPKDKRLMTLELSDLTPVGSPVRIIGEDKEMDAIVNNANIKFTGKKSLRPSLYRDFGAYISPNPSIPSLVFVQFYNARRKSPEEVQKLKKLTKSRWIHYYQLISPNRDLVAFNFEMRPDKSFITLEDLSHITPVGYPIELPGSKSYFSLTERKHPRYMFEGSDLKANALYDFDVQDKERDGEPVRIIQLYYIDFEAVQKESKKPWISFKFKNPGGIDDLEEKIRVLEGSEEDRSSKRASH